jgi:hypothetical protein
VCAVAGQYLRAPRPASRPPSPLLHAR